MQKYFNNVQNTAGDAIPYAQVTVTLTATGATATIYSDDGVTTRANPIVCDAKGYYEFFAADGLYTLTFAGTRLVTASVANIQLLSSGSGVGQLGFSHASSYTAGTVGAKLKLDVNVTDAPYSAAWDGSTDDASAINAAIDAAAAAGGGVVRLPEGTGVIGSTLTLKTGVRLVGEGYGVSTLKLKTGSNTDMIKTTGYGTFASMSDAGVPRDFGVEQLTLDGNYLNDAWNSATNTINNSTGYGMKVEGYGFSIDVELINIPEVGLRVAGEGSIPTTQNAFGNIKVFGRVFGKEGVILTGPNDFEVERAWLGLCGILKRPEAETTFATSTEYAGDPVAGVVLDGVNVEVGRWHIYACWSGPGIKTRNTVRLEGDHIISESNNAQIDLSSSTYGAVSTISLRNLSLHHPNWTDATPSYTSPDSRWDGFTCAAVNFQCGNLRIYRTITAITRVPETNGLVCSGTACSFTMTYSNSSPTDASDPDFGGRYIGGIALISGTSNYVSVAARASRGAGVSVSGSQNVITATINDPDEFGVQVAGSQCIINAVVNSQAQDGGSGAAFHNAGSNNIWNTSGTSNAVPYTSSTGLGRTLGDNINSTTRSFTIASGVITVTTFDSRITVDTEAAAASDDLDTIDGGATWQQLRITAANSARDVVIKDGTGNLRTAGDFTLTHAQDFIVLEFDGTNWIEVSRSDNTA